MDLLSMWIIIIIFTEYCDILLIILSFNLYGQPKKLCILRNAMSVAFGGKTHATDSWKIGSFNYYFFLQSNEISYKFKRKVLKFKISLETRAIFFTAVNSCFRWSVILPRSKLV